MSPPKSLFAAACMTLGLVVVGQPVVFAQQLDPHAVQPERPSVATHAGTVAPGWFEVEFGSERDRYDDRSIGVSVPVVGKLGLASHVQLSVFGTGISAPGSGTFGIGDLTLGVKWRLADAAPVLGSIAVLPSVKMPTGAEATGAGTGTTDGSLLLISSHTFGPVALDLNAGYTRRTGDGSAAPRDATVWAISFGGPAIGEVGWVAEVYGYPKTGGPVGQEAIVATLIGPTFSVRSWLALDVGVIVPITGPQPRAVYVGGVWNAGRVWR